MLGSLCRTSAVPFLLVCLSISQYYLTHRNISVSPYPSALPRTQPTTSKPKVAVLMYGEIRSIKRTCENVSRSLLHPLSGLSIMDLIVHEHHAPSIPPDRCGSNVADLQCLRFDRWATHVVTTQASTATTHFFRKALQEFGDAWQNQFKSLHNYVDALLSLVEVFRFMESVERARGVLFDVVVVTRMDLEYRMPVDVKRTLQLIQRNPASVVVPFKHWYGDAAQSVNDRFAVGNRAIMAVYALRIHHAASLASLFKRPVHAETLVAQVLQFHSIAPISSPIITIRRRIDCSIAPLDAAALQCVQGLPYPWVDAHKTCPVHFQPLYEPTHWSDSSTYGTNQTWKTL